jgi:hypothetical protein
MNINLKTVKNQNYVTLQNPCKIESFSLESNVDKIKILSSSERIKNIDENYKFDYLSFITFDIKFCRSKSTNSLVKMYETFNNYLSTETLFDNAEMFSSINELLVEKFKISDDYLADKSKQKIISKLNITCTDK